jgi:hypothetical protein
VRTAGTTNLCVGITFLLLAGAASAGTEPGVVLGWGDNASGQLRLPASLTNVVSVAGGGFHSLALLTSGEVVSWGLNTYGQTNVPSDLLDVSAIAGGAYHCLALRSNGTVRAWGSGALGETNVPSTVTNATAIAAGFSHSLALKADGKVVAWGLGTSGQTNVPTGLTNAVALACGSYHSLALRADGTVVAWGDNSYGQSKVPSGLTNVVGIGAGFRHSLALKADGTVVGWGDSSFGQTNSPPDLTNAVQVTVGAYHNLARRADGTVAAWGYNSSGQTNVPAGLNQVIGVSAGYSHSLAVTLQPSLLVKPPRALELAEADAASLHIRILSGPAVDCQWFFDGTPIAAATGLDLEIDGFTLAKAGSYSVVVSNQYGTLNSTTSVRLTNSPVILVDGIDAGGGKMVRVDSSRITMTSSLPLSRIYYTLDGTTPDFQSTPYLTNALTLTNTAIVQAIAYDSAYTISAPSAPLTVELVPTFVLNATSPGGGTVTVSPAPYSSGGRYLSNSVVTLIANPVDGWSFLRWEGDFSGTSNVTSVTLERPVSVKAIFGAPLNLHTNGSGWILLDPPAQPYPYGTSVQLAAVPMADAYFFSWAGVLSGSANPVSLTITSPGTVTALFAGLPTNTASLTVLPEVGGTVSLSPQAPFYTNGSVVRLTAIPAPGFNFGGWSGAVEDTANPLVFTLNSNTVVRANFSRGSATNRPVIIKAPGSWTLAPGGNAWLSIQVAGTEPFAYQWRFNGLPLPSATDPTLVLADVQPGEVGLYDVVVTNAFGMVTSSAAAVSLFGLQVAAGSEQGIPLLTLDSAPGSVFELQTSSSLSQTNWMPLSTVRVGNQRFYYVDLAFSNNPAKFYRALRQ